MLIKLLVICIIIPSIIIDANDSRDFMEKPILDSGTRVGKFLGLFSAPKNPFPIFLSKNKQWRGALMLSFGRYPVFASAVEYNHVHTKDPYCFFCLQHPQQFNTLVNQHSQQPQEFLSNDGITNVNGINSHISALTQHDPLNNSLELPLNSTSILASATASLTTTSETTTVKSQEKLRTLKLEDYDSITFDPNRDGLEDDIETMEDDDDDDDDDVSVLNRVSREIQDLRQESNDEIGSTTIESSTQQQPMISPLPMMAIAQENNQATTINPMLELPQKPSQDFLSTTISTDMTTTNEEINKNSFYSTSKYPNAQYISIAHEPQNTYGYSSQIQPPMKNYYNFYPSQPDYGYYYKYNTFVPYCYSNLVQKKFTPSSYYNGLSNTPIENWQNYIR